MTDFIINFLLQFNVIIENNYELSIILYFIFSLIFFTMSLPGTLIIVLASSFFFGFYVGFLINIISVVFGSLIFFIFFKKIFNNYFIKYLENYSEKLNKLVKKSSYEYLILLRLISAIPLFIQNIFLSTLHISKKKFLISSFLGLSPYFLFFTFVGDQFSSLIELKSFEMKNLLTTEFILIILVLIIILISRIFFKIK